jgi:predicted small integral membrane protein
MNRSEAAGAIDRVLAILLATIPMGMGLLAFVNNISDWSHSVHDVITPLLTLDALRDLPQFSWRAFPPRLVPVCYGLVTTIELSVSVVAFVGVVSMLRQFGAAAADFIAACRIAQRACTLGIITWLLFFFVLGGDWFLSWKSKSLLFIQSDALMYVAASTFVLIALRATEARLANDASPH